MSTLTIRFAGICCFLDPRPDKKDKFQKRVVLPVDLHAHERHDGPHIPYLEIDILDEPIVRGRFAADKLYAREAGSYHRFHLSGDRISIRNAKPPQYGLRVLSTYEERIPHLSKVTPGTAFADAQFFNNSPSPEKLAAYFDIDFGDLHAGPSSLYPTKFTQPTEWPTRRLANWVELQIPFEDGVKPVIEIESFNGNGFGKRSIEISASTDHITIGNQLLTDIERTLSNAALSVEDFSAHFSLVYDLLPSVPSNASRPVNTFTSINGCIGTTLP